MRSQTWTYFIRIVRRLIEGLIALLSVFGLCACVTSPMIGAYGESTLSALSIDATGRAAATQAAHSMSTNAAAGTLVAGATLSARDAMALATVQRAATLDALALTPAASTGVALQATNDSIHAQSTRDANTLSTLDAQRAIQLAATSNALAISSTEEVKRQQNATSAAAMFAYLPTCFAILLLIGAVVVLLAIVHLLEDKKSRHRVESMLHTTPSGTFIVVWDEPTRTLISRPIDAQLAAPAAPAHEHEHEQKLIAGPTYRAGSLVQVWPSTWGVEQDKENERARQTLADVLRLLDDAMTVSERGSNKIPRYDKMPNWATRPLDWKRITDRLVDCGYAIKRAGPPIAHSDTGGGTYLTRGYTLYTLSAALRKGTIKMRRASQTA